MVAFLGGGKGAAKKNRQGSESGGTLKVLTCNEERRLDTARAGEGPLVRPLWGAGEGP